MIFEELEQDTNSSGAGRLLAALQAFPDFWQAFTTAAREDGDGRSG